MPLLQIDFTYYIPINHRIGCSNTGKDIQKQEKDVQKQVKVCSKTGIGRSKTEKGHSKIGKDVVK